MKRYLIAVMAGAVICVMVQAQTAGTAVPPPTNAATTVGPFGTQIKKTVVFIQLVCQDGNFQKDVRGTGFLVSIPAPSISANASFDYLVTNRHVALCWSDQNVPMQVRSIGIRANMRNGVAAFSVLNPQGNVDWVLPADDAVDLAVLPVTPNEAADVLSVPVDMFATRDFLTSKNVAEGARIAFTGFFYQFAGEHKIQPIVREGILAMMPDETLVTTTHRPGKVYLGDIHIFGGNSGSPVFINTAGLGEDFHFLGVISGMFYEDEDFTLEVATTLKGKQYANSGIAMIVPADDVKAVLDQPRLKAMRDSALAKSRGNSGK